MTKPTGFTGKEHDHGENAPHGGIWVEHEDGFVEISVFEAGVPPRFRLFFFDRQRHPQTPYDPDAVALDTLRSEGCRQTFGFCLQDDCLESTSDIPEPHEFTIELKLTHDEHTHIYHIQFTEDDHDHSRYSHQGHEHGSGEHTHGHEHGTSILGWLRSLYGHSHSIAEKTDSAMESNERGIWALQQMPRVDNCCG